MSDSQKYKAELYDEVWQKATGMGYMNVTMALEAVAALREELAKFDEGMRALACSLGAGGYNAETLTADQLVGKVQWGIDNLITVQERRLTVAEQRNAECIALLRRSAAGAGQDLKTWWNDRALILQAALKPKPKPEAGSQ
jgi:hypothetical protein